MSSQTKFKKDKEIIGEYETQVKGEIAVLQFGHIVDFKGGISLIRCYHSVNLSSVLKSQDYSCSESLSSDSHEKNLW